MNTFISVFAKRLIKETPVTGLLLFVNTAMLIVILVTGGFHIQNLINWGALYPPAFFDDQAYYQLLAAMFLHGGIIHYIFNSLALIILGSALELFIGPKRFAIVYFTAGIISSVAVVFLGDRNIVTIGASGAIWGIMGSLLVLTLKKPTWFQPSAIASIRKMVIINAVFTFLVPNISVIGHLSGGLIGALVMYLLIPKSTYLLKRYRRNHVQYEGNEIIIHEEEEAKD